ncbi:Chase sensor signal transduction histidine kinase [Calothrix sp. NIES-4071]|nr:Chase sensor signal transduction histidine kinase [Calothrix sp. NIES-4071]BAZ55216.1 Chase sensor signal transduction histidine kinase [Calothrix sp. NIES-4105]
MKWSVEGKWIASGFAIVMTIIGYISFISYQNATRLAETIEKVKDTHEVIETLIGVVASLNEAESGRRGYILLGSELELLRYNQAVQEINPRIRTLENLFVDNSNQKQRLTTLKSLLAQRVVISEQTIKLYRKNPSLQRNQNKFVTDNNHNRSEIQQLIEQMQSQEKQALDVWVKQSQSNIQSRMLIEILGTFLTFVLLFGVYAQLYRQLVKRQQAEAKQLQLTKEKELGEMKLQFFSMASHEFRTPLSIILGSSQLLEESLQSLVEKKKLKNLYRIQSNARLMAQLLSDILTLSRAEAGKLEYKPQLLEMQSFCLNLIEDMQTLSETNHAIKFEMSGSATNAWVDEKLLYSILSNLLYNAIKYSPQSQNIYFKLKCENQAIVFQVKDQGIGISQASQHEIYEPFRRGENTKGILGTGLGLAVVKKCIDLHQGQIHVKSQEGVGTTFTITIPQSTRIP